MLSQRAVAMDPFLIGEIEQAIRQDGMQAASDGERSGSRCDDPGGESSGRDDFSADSGRDQPRSGGIGRSEDVEKAIECGLHLLDQLASSPDISQKDKPCIILVGREVPNNPIICC